MDVSSTFVHAREIFFVDLGTGPAFQHLSQIRQMTEYKNVEKRGLSPNQHMGGSPNCNRQATLVQSARVTGRCRLFVCRFRDRRAQPRIAAEERTCVTQRPLLERAPPPRSEEHTSELQS